MYKQVIVTECKKVILVQLLRNMKEALWVGNVSRLREANFLKWRQLFEVPNVYLKIGFSWETAMVVEYKGSFLERVVKNRHGEAAGEASSFQNSMRPILQNPSRNAPQTQK